MKKIASILLALVLIPTIAAAEQVQIWSLLIPFDNNTHTLLTILKNDEKIAVASVEINLALAGYSYSENNGIIEIQMDDGIHKAQIVGDKLFYQLLPDSYTVMLSAVDGYDPVFSTTDGSFNTGALSVKNNFEKTMTQTQKQSSPITIPSGVYVAGDDFPAGVYRIELADGTKTGHIRLYDNMDKIKKAFSYIYDYDLGSYYGSTAIGKIEILEGNALEIRNTTVLLMPYEGLK